MTIAERFLPEFDQEIAATRSVLQRLPEDRLSWKPHEKSMTLGRLASHMAELPGWIPLVLAEPELDFAAPGMEDREPLELGTTEEILSLLDENAGKARSALAETSDGAFSESWTLRRGEQVLVSAPRDAVFRRFMLNHLIHHRGQATVYLRLAGAHVPQTYGPSADEPEF